jgi:hypothetical protein
MIILDGQVYLFTEEAFKNMGILTNDFEKTTVPYHSLLLLMFRTQKQINTSNMKQ